ncbi:MAG: glycyl-radical enzyme activating protein [Clostridia bacterium]|nr:glycyl-radical enzyme activating protein [Clostridia bacterium]
MTGTVFSIEEFAIHDGPGVRTTVFLKGCPLSCVWCHSPEGQGFSPEILRAPNGCLSCGACLEIGKEQTGHAELVPDSATVCPRHLIRTSGITYTPTALTEKLLKNADFLRASGGGITFSGGEPLAQPFFLGECLRLLSGKLHRALQTAGYAPRKVFRQILAHCDFVLFDLKIMDPNRHKRYCGVENGQILANYRVLAASDTPFITRVPLIPTLSDTEENLTAIAQLLREYRISRVELLPYHRFTGSKYTMTGKTYRPPFDEALPPQPHTEIFNSYGIEVHIL